MLSCSKEWLEEKQDIKLIVPTTLNDMALLMNGDIFSYDGRGMSETSCDDFEFNTEQFNQLSWPFDRDFITWSVQRDLPNIAALQQNEWSCAYNQIQICNVVLKGLAKIDRNEKNASFYDEIKGAALYYRAKQFLNLAMTFCNYYDAKTAKDQMGIPLKLDDDISERIQRASLEDTYTRIVQDLKLSSKLLPSFQKSYARLAKGGSYALLARTLLFMDSYQEAKDAADSSYKYHYFLEDYNTINAVGVRPLMIESKEIHVLSNMVKVANNPETGRVSQELFDQYSANDLRKKLFFKVENDGKESFKGHYTVALFTGTTTAEVLLIKAECLARLNDSHGAMSILNSLMSKRFDKNNFIPFVAETGEEALAIILKERRKELITRGLRWQDLKRLNRDDRFSKTLVRRIGSETYTLPPNDRRYVLPIPLFVINYNGILQNQY